MSLDRIAYIVRNKAAWIYAPLEAFGRVVTLTLYKKHIRRATGSAVIVGRINGLPARMQPLEKTDFQALAAFIDSIPERYLQFFHPHSFDYDTVRKILATRTILTYGLWIDERLSAYALIKLMPTRKAYIGRLVAPELAGGGIGRFLSRYLYWQTALLGFKPCSTINKSNQASLKSNVKILDGAVNAAKPAHAAVMPYKVVAELPNDFLLIEFHLTALDETPPELMITKPATEGNPLPSP